MSVIKFLPKDLHQIEGHPFILKAEVEFNSVKYIMVFNVINRMDYVMFETKYGIFLLGSHHTSYKRTKESIKEAETLKDLADSLVFGVLDSLINIESNPKIDKIACTLQYIKDGEILEKNVDVVDGFRTLKGLTTDAETIDVLDSIING